jgi:hypothetical protein
LHEAPLAFAGLEHVPVAALQVPAVWHWSGAAHATGLLPVHTPTWHVSVCEHALPSLQLVPSDFAGLEHAPVAGLQDPAVWHWSGAAQVTGLAPVQVPAWQVSVRVQALPSLHEVPSDFGGLEQMPVALLQVPAVWHWSGAAHATGLAPVQVPDSQVSVCVQASPSLHEVPLAFTGLEQVPVAVLQVPAV